MIIDFKHKLLPNFLDQIVSKRDSLLLAKYKTKQVIKFHGGRIRKYYKTK